jgi:hypothetical protein
MASTKPTAEEIADLKDEGRLDRMQSKHKALETVGHLPFRSRSTRDSSLVEAQRIAQQWQNHAMKLCDEFVKTYWLCRQESGMLVVFKCREPLKAMHECVADKTRDQEAFGRFREERLAVIGEVLDHGEYLRPSHREFEIPKRE